MTRAVEACRVRAEREQVALELSVADGLPLVDLDERAIEIAVINLVDNALKYAPDGELVSIAVRQQNGSIEIRVSDQGPGIPAEDRRRIFERFVRGKTALGKQVRGSGIGLALVKHIAEAHGGGVWVEDAMPHGSLFVLTLSLLRDLTLVRRGLHLEQLFVARSDHCTRNLPCVRMARARKAARPDTLSFRNMDASWFATVRSEVPRRDAISLRRLPSIEYRATSYSHGVSRPRTLTTGFVTLTIH